MRSRKTVAALLVVLASCASAPDLRYYTLDMTPSGRTEAGVNLLVEPFTVAESLDRTQIVIQATPTRIEYYATDRWAASVGAMVQHKLTAEFGPAVDRRTTLKISGRVLDFEQVDGEVGPIGRVRLQVTVRGASTQRYEAPLLERSYAADRAAEADTADAVVRALSRAVEDIAVEIAADASGITPPAM